jgi:hypothetical protein
LEQRKSSEEKLERSGHQTIGDIENKAYKQGSVTVMSVLSASVKIENAVQESEDHHGCQAIGDVENKAYKQGFMTVMSVLSASIKTKNCLSNAIIPYDERAPLG